MSQPNGGALMAGLHRQAAEVASTARARGERIVLAESCTAGLVAHLLSTIPGASDWFCGACVVYRNATKTAWLGVPASLLNDPARGPVCAVTASEMTVGVLRITPEATLAASITGHLGPQAPAGLDGIVYIGLQRRSAQEAATQPQVERFQLPEDLPGDAPLATLRAYRQHLAARLVLERLAAALR